MIPCAENKVKTSEETQWQKLKSQRIPTNYAIVHGYNMEALELVREACAQFMDRPPIAEYQVGCVISINTGLNTIGILYRT